MKLLLILSISACLSSCAFHYGSIGSSSSSEDLYYHDIALGFSQTKQFFNIGGNAKDALVLQAKKNLAANRPLKPGERYANYVVDFKVKYVPFLRHLECTVSADVVSESDGKLEPFSELYIRKTGSYTDKTGLFSVGDTVHVAEVEYVVVGFRSDKRLTLAATKNFQTRYVNKKKKTVTSQIESYRGYQLGDTVLVNGLKQRVSGFLIDKIETANRSGTYYKTSYTDVKK